MNPTLSLVLPSPSLGRYGVVVFLVGCLLSLSLGAGAVTMTDSGAGTITASSGIVRILARDGRIAAGSKGASIYPGDLLETAHDGQADLRFSDDSVLSLRPHSRFRVDEYSYTGRGDGSDRGLFSLLRGSFRTVTGLIGKLRHSTYAVTTPTATIGIRGTEYTATVGKALNVSVQRGEITLTNRSGMYAVSEGQAAVVRSRDAAPQLAEGGPAPVTTEGAAPGNVRIQGTTKIEASQHGAAAVGGGGNSSALNQAGVIGGR